MSLGCSVHTPRPVQPPARRAQVRCVGQPAQAELWLDGAYVAPCALGRFHVAPGRRLIEIRHDGYAVHYVELMAQAGQVHAIEYELVADAP